MTLSASFGGTGAATTLARSDHDHAGQAWSGGFIAGPTLRVDNIATGGFADGILGVGQGVGQGRGVVGYATAPTGVNIGVWGQADSTEGRGIFGYGWAGRSGLTGSRP